MNPKDQTFTRGPWTISVDNRHIEAPGGYIIAENYNHAPGYMVNLHLIAAAPELYEALKSILDQLAWKEIVGLDDEVYDIAYAALQKAEES